MDSTRTTRLIQLEEGRRLTAYRDSFGHWTIGDGYNLEAHGYAPDECEGMVWTAAQADAATQDEIDAVVAEIDRRWPKWRELDDVRQAAIVSSVYQLGAPGASKFFFTIHALQERDYETAAKQMLASRWAKQTPARVQRNAEMIRTGQWPEEVNGVKFLVDPDPVVAATPAQSAPCPVPADRLPDVPGQGDAMGQEVREGVPAGAGVGVRLSKKLCVAAAGAVILLFGPAVGIHLSPDQTKTITDILVTYLVGQSGVDALTQISVAIGRYNGGDHA